MIIKYKEFEVEADTQEDAIDKIVKLAIEKDRGENELEVYAEKLVIAWCLCDYLTKYGDKNNIIEHAVTNLLIAFLKCQKVKFKNLDSRKIKKDFLEKIWIEEEECLENPSNMISALFIEVFDDEGIEYEDDKYLEIAKDFVNEIQKIISLVLEKRSYEKCIEYISARFNYKSIK